MCTIPNVVAYFQQWCSAIEHEPTQPRHHHVSAIATTEHEYSCIMHQQIATRRVNSEADKYEKEQNSGKKCSY